MFPLIKITPSIFLPTYYFIISVTLCIGLICVVRRADSSHLSRKVALDVSLILMVAGFVGARLFHVFYESPEYYKQDWLRVFEFWQGGFVFYGGAITSGIISILFLQKKTNGFFGSYFDLFAPIVSFSYLLGRVGCFLAGCCYGKYCDLPWSVAGRHPTQLYAVFWELGVLLIILGSEKIPPQNRRPAFLGRSGGVFYLWMFLHSCGRLLMEAFRDDFRGPKLGLSISSWISIFFLVLALYLILRKPAIRRSTLPS